MGKVYSLDVNGAELEDATFDGAFDVAARCWHRRDAFFGKVIEKFLIHHRNHEIRFVPEGVDEYLEKKLGSIEGLDANGVLSLPRDEPDWQSDLDLWRKNLGIPDP
jgi:hypothetical protein